MMNILLVQPEHPDTFWSFKHVLRFVRKKAAYPPLGLLTVAAMLPDAWRVRLTDMNVHPLTDEAIEWADMIFLSAMIVHKENVKEIISRCSHKIIVAGGPLFAGWRTTGIDHYILNEAEVTLPRFLRDLEKGIPKSQYSSKKWPDVAQTPVPRWDLINMKDYATMNIQYSRGCPYNCEFCDVVRLNGRVPRTKSPQQMVMEFEALYRAGWRGGVFVVDDNFIGNRQKVKVMLRHLIRWQRRRRYPFQLLTEASTNLADDEELMHLMSKANFNKVFLGLETPNPESLRECSKFQNTNRSLSDTVKAIHGHGMQVMGGFIVGFDSDPETIFQTQIDFIQKIGVVTAMVGILNALPHTRLWKRLKEEGRILSDAAGQNDTHINFKPKMHKDMLLEGYKRIIGTIYHPRNYYRRIHRFISHYRPTSRARISGSDIYAFFRSVWQIGILSGARRQYWWLLLKTLFTNVRALPIAVELAIYGVHFELLAKKIVRA